MSQYTKNTVITSSTYEARPWDGHQELWTSGIWGFTILALSSLIYKIKKEDKVDFLDLPFHFMEKIESEWDYILNRN